MLICVTAVNRGKVLAVVPLVLLALPTDVSGNPSDQDSHAAMAIHDLTGSKELLNQASGLCAKALEDMQGIAASQGKATAKQLAEVHVNLRRLQRLANDLQIHGETAGVDFSFRTRGMQDQLTPAIVAFAGNRANASQIARIGQALHNPRLQQKIKNAVANTQRFQREQKWLEAYSLLEDTFDEVTSYTTFLPAHEGERELRVYVPLLQEIWPRRNTLLREQVQAKLEEAGAPLVPDTEELLRAVTAAAAALQSESTASVAGESLSGPRCLDSFFRRWQGIQLSALRCRAIDWARRVAVPRVASASTPANRVDDAQYTAFCEQLIQGLVSIVAADAQRTNAAEAPQLYAQYLQVLGPVLPRMSDGRLEAALGPALDQLVSKSLELAEQVTAYRAATDELLRWRERIAGEEAAARDGRFPASRTALEQAFAAREDYRGLIAANQPALAEAKLQGSCPEVLLGATGQIVQRSVRLEKIASLQAGRVSVAVYDNRHFATLSTPEVSGAIELLKRDLLVTDELVPALSLDAAVAVASAEQGDFEAAGGTVEHVHLEGLIPRFATLTPAVLPITRMGPLPSEPSDRLLLPHVLVRLQVIPAWVRHRYFFAEWTSAASTGESE